MISEERLRELWNGSYPQNVSAYTQARFFARAVEREAYEAAAKVCEESPGDRLPYGCAAAIRALIQAA